ncbi:MAG TPA: hypothetical protein VI893_09540, partial [Thermoplasmata archaeon]|nr:hypothetical protein [Thermoplasmata archaeon]
TVEGTAYRLWVNIPAKQHRVVTFQLEEVIDKVGGAYHYRYPLEEERVSNPAKITLSVRIATAQPLSEARVTSHPIALDRPADNLASFKLNAVPGQYDRDLVVRFASAASGSSAVHTTKLGDDRYWSAAIQPPADLQAEHGRKVLFMLDKSGSSKRSLPEEIWRPALERALVTLRPNDVVNLGVFSSRATFALNGFHPASAVTSERIVEFARNAKATGSTNLDMSLAEAGELLLQGPLHLPPVLVLITDGRWTSGDSRQHTVMDRFHELMMSRGIHPVLVTGVGRGSEVHAVDEVGSMFRGLPSARLETEPDGLAERLQGAPVPLVHDIVVTSASWNAGSVVASGGSIPANSELVLVGRGATGTGGEVVLRGHTGHGGWGASYSVDMTPASEDPAIPRIWALRTVEKMLGEIMVYGESTDRIEALKQVAYEFSIVTPYTSLLVEQPAKGIPPPGGGSGAGASQLIPAADRGASLGASSYALAAPFLAAGGVLTPWISQHRHGWQAQDKKDGEQAQPLIEEDEIDLRLAEGTSEANKARQFASEIQNGEFVDLIETSDGRIVMISNDPHYHGVVAWGWFVDIVYTILLVGPFVVMWRHHKKLDRIRQKRLLKTRLKKEFGLEEKDGERQDSNEPGLTVEVYNRRSGPSPGSGRPPRGRHV